MYIELSVELNCNYGCSVHVYIIFFIFISWFPDGLTVRNWSLIYSGGTLRLTVRNCRQEWIPVGQPT